MAVLDHPRLADITFVIDGTRISRNSYTQVRDAIERGDIRAEQHALPSSVRGFYLSQNALHKKTGAVLIDANTFVLPFPRAVTTAQMVTVVHEATHAFFDIRAFGSAPGSAPVHQGQIRSDRTYSPGNLGSSCRGGPISLNTPIS